MRHDPRNGRFNLPLELQSPHPNQLRSHLYPKWPEDAAAAFAPGAWPFPGFPWLPRTVDYGPAPGTARLGFWARRRAAKQLAAMEEAILAAHALKLPLLPEQALQALALRMPIPSAPPPGSMGVGAQQIPFHPRAGPSPAMLKVQAALQQPHIGGGVPDATATAHEAAIQAGIAPEGLMHFRYRQRGWTF